MALLNPNERIEKFLVSECYASVKVRQLQWFLRGQQVDLGDKKQLKMVDNVFRISTADKVANLLGYALNAPLRSFKEIEDEEVERQLAHGDICFFEERDAKMIRKVVGKMKRDGRDSPYCFTLIPLSVVVDYENLDTVYETLLIKVHRNSKCYYVDTAARVYKSLEHYLDTCQLPYSILCFPRNGQHSFDETGDVEIECRNVGLKNRVFKVTDLVLGAVGVVSSFGAIFASGGLAIPFIAAGVGTAVYSGSRSIANLVDSGRHGMSVNPFTDISALNNWLVFMVNTAGAVTLGASAAISALTTAETTASTFGQLALALKGITTGTDSDQLSMVDLVVFNVVEWKRLPTNDKLLLACSICFCFRKVISFHNAERLIHMVRLRQICQYFKRRINPPNTSCKNLISNIRQFMLMNESYTEKGMAFVRALLQSDLKVKVNEEFTVIQFDEFVYKISHIFRIELSMIDSFVSMIQLIFPNLKEAFSIIRKHFDNESILKVVCKYADSLGGNRVHLEQAINEFIHFFMILFPILNDTPCLIDPGIVVGKGHRFTIGSAFNIFVVHNQVKAIPLVKALVELKPREAEQLNALRDRQEIQEELIFKWITEGTDRSADMLAKARFLLSIDDHCIEQSLRITDLNLTRGTIEVEALFEVDPKLMSRIALDKHGGWSTLGLPHRATR